MSGVRVIRNSSRKKFHGRDSMRPKDAIAPLGTFADAQTDADVAFSVRRINVRVRRERVETAAKVRERYLSSLLPRWNPNEGAGS